MTPRRDDEEGKTMMDGAESGAPMPLADLLATFSVEDQADIRAHADLLIQESRTIAQFRNAVGMTQAELARALETSQAYVAKLERRSSAEMQFSTIARIAAALGGEAKVVVSLPGKPDAILAVLPPSARKRVVRAKVA